MNTKRTPFARPLRHPISETALEAFRLMRELEGKCTCPPRNWHGEYWKHQQCKACGDWWEQNSILHDALQLRPWQWPAVENPAAENPYSAGSPAAAHWKPKLRHKRVGARSKRPNAPSNPDAQRLRLWIPPRRSNAD
jgi:hypothetical protein